MKTFAYKIWKRFLSFCLLTSMIFSVFSLSASAFADGRGETVDAKYGPAFVGYDGSKVYHNPDDYIMLYNSDGSVEYIKDGLSIARNKMYLYSSDGTFQPAYCIQNGVLFGAGSQYSSELGENSSYFMSLPASVRFGIRLTLAHGWQPGKAIPISGINEDDFIFATQTIIWEYQQKVRISPTQRVDNGPIKEDQYYNAVKDKSFERAYNYILGEMARHATVPSFASSSPDNAPVYELKYNPEKNNFSITLTDTNSLNIDFLQDMGIDGVTITRNQNSYTVTSDRIITNPVCFGYKKDIDIVGKNMLIWGSPGKQVMATGVSDPVRFFMNIRTETYGVGHIVKTSEDDKVEGIRFRIEGNGVNETVTTNKDGSADISLLPGIYTVTEETDSKYEPQNVQRITIVSNQTSTVTFNNILKRGSLTVTKTSEDGLTEGVKFHLYGKSLSGLAVDEYAVTDSNGIAAFDNVLISGDTPYTLEEADTASKYIIPEKQTTVIEWNKVTNKSFDNILKKWQLTVTKSDKETGIAQGDASLGGAKYGIYKGDQLVDTYTTDSNGQFTTKSYICDSDWSLREITPSEGYLVTSGSEHIGAEPKLYTVEYNSTALDVIETVHKGRIAVIKHCDNGETQIETPESGAEFEVFLKSSGSYEAAKESERDIIICDEFGFAETKDLPYGFYTVKQTKGWEGKELLPSFDVSIKENGETYRYLINNATFEALIEIVKKDIETDNVIPASGIGFKVRNTDTGEYIVQHINYPTPVDIDIYYTDSTGKLMMPEALPYGNYEIIEQNTCYGYVLDSEPVPFKVDGSQTVVTVEKHNVAQKGTITVSKSGEVFSSVTAVSGGYVDEDGNDIAFPNLYQPVYSVQGLAGAVYEVTAAEDIYTLDGTLRYAKGDVVAEITTDENGTAVTEPLYLGKFEVREKTAPFGMVISDEVHPVELTYAGQEVKITETATAFYNERQKAEISLSKVLEKNEIFELGNNNEILSVQFGLFAADNLTAANGSVIPANGLLEIVSCDENGNVMFRTDIPVGAKLYVKELAVDAHYILSDKKYPMEFAYAGQEIADVEIRVNDGEAVNNDLIYGTIKGLKIDRETEEAIAGALFGLFRSDETEFTAEKAILTAESSENGIFTFENVPYGIWFVKELQPAGAFLSNEKIYPVTVSENEQFIEITVVNDRIPEIGTLAAVDGEKEICTTEVFTLTDTVSYKHLIPGKEYVLKGVLMDKTTDKPLLIDDQEIHAETVFTPDEPLGVAIVEFTFDSKYIKADTDIVVFESLYKDGKELAVHADIEDEDQTVTVKVSEIGTQATAEGEKEITAKGSATIDDIVSYRNLTPGKEYTVKGILMNKKTGEPFIANGKEITAEITFIPEKPDGEIKVSFTFDTAGITTETEVVVFERLFRNGVEIAYHTDIEDDGQTVKITLPVLPVPENPETSDNSNLGFWIGLAAVALGGLISVLIIRIKQKKDNDDE